MTDLVSDDPEVALEIRNDDGSVGALPGGYEPGTGFDLAVTWSPASTRFLATTIHLHSNTDEPTTPIDLVGQARALEPCSLSVFPTELRFGQVEPGTEIRLDVHLRNVEATACLISDVRVGVEGDAAFQVEPIDELLLEPGQEHRIPVRFVAPPAQDEPVHVTGDLRFEVIDTDYVQHVVPLLGVSRNHCVTISQPNLEFLVEPGCQSQARSIEVSNGGCESAVEIQDILLLGGPDCDGFDDGCAFEVVGPLLPEVVKEPLAFDIVYQPGGPAKDVGVALIYVSGESNPLAVGLHGHGQAAEFRTDTFDGEEPSRVDLLWVIDNSSCNTPAQLALADHLPTFLAFADQHAIDFQMGVTTTDVSDTGERGRLVPLPPSTGPRVLTSGMQDLEDLFAANVQVGTAGSSIEEGLEAAYLAMELRDLVDDPSTPEADDGNQGLVRDDAALSIIIVSDEADQSPRSPSTYAAYFRSLGRQDRVRVHGITPDPLTDCGYGPGVGERYQEVIDATGGHWASICDPDWSATLQELGRQAFDFDSLRGRYLLNSVPVCDGACDDRDAPALQVKVASTATPPWSAREQVWRYDAVENAIVFSQQARPAAGTAVEVTYRPQCTL